MKKIPSVITHEEYSEFKSQGSTAAHLLEWLKL